MFDPNKVRNQVKNGEVTLDQLLYPGKQLYEVDVDKLPIKTMPSGFATLDKEYMLLKECEGELVIIGGRPSMGKSALMFQIALNVSEKLPVHVFSLEMSQESIVRRLLSTLINKPIRSIQRGLVSKGELNEAVKKLKAYNYIIDDRAGLDIQTLCDTARTRARKDGTRLLVIDYLQLLRTPKGHSKDAEIGEITRSLKQLAKDIGCPVIVGSQLNRQCEIRGSQSGDYRPLLSDLRESGSIEQDADIVIAVHREYRYTQLRLNEADIIILKNRNGAVGEVVMQFHPAKTRFEDTGDDIG